MAALPRSVSEAVAGRLARLSAAARETAQAAAVCGPRAHPALLAAVCPDAAGALAECIDAGVLVVDTDTVGFRHELARRATAERIPAYQRRLLHKQVLTALAAPPIDPDSLGALAFHADHAGDTDAVIGYGPAAAERAAVLGANREAAELYALVLRHADTIPGKQKVIWLEQHAISSYLSGVADASVRSFHAAVTLRHNWVIVLAREMTYAGCPACCFRWAAPARRSRRAGIAAPARRPRTHPAAGLVVTQYGRADRLRLRPGLRRVRGARYHPGHPTG